MKSLLLFLDNIPLNTHQNYWYPRFCMKIHWFFGVLMNINLYPKTIGSSFIDWFLFHDEFCFLCWCASIEFSSLQLIFLFSMEWKWLSCDEISLNPPKYILSLIPFFSNSMELHWNTPILSISYCIGNSIYLLYKTNIIIYQYHWFFCLWWSFIIIDSFFVLKWISIEYIHRSLFLHSISLQYNWFLSFKMKFHQWHPSL